MYLSLEVAMPVALSSNRIRKEILVPCLLHAVPGRLSSCSYTQTHKNVIHLELVCAQCR